jgi:acyl-CoA synthetase (AMP-forming)/AMP-acid ligase II/1-acyl-sn-glycerol-3-phosphate acyltransferase/acyl carrier protein
MFKKITLNTLSLILRFSLSLRYRWTVKGYEKVLKAHKDSPDKGILFLPNHPAAFDPLFVSCVLWRNFSPSPVAVEYIFRNKILNALLCWMGGLSIPNFMKGNNSYKQEKGEETLQKVSNLLSEGKQVLFYPSGKLRLDNVEIVGGASGIYSLLKNNPDIHVVAIRTQGLWGSMSSRALTGKVLCLGGLIKKGFKIVLKNFIFFVPKRNVSVEMELLGDDFPRNSGRLEINRYLEKWFNGVDEQGKLIEEPLRQVSYSFWNKKVPELSLVKTWNLPEPEKIPNNIKKHIGEEIARLTKMKIDEFNFNDLLQTDLGMDSLDVAALISFIKYHYQVTHANPDQVTSVLSAYALAAKLIEPIVDDIAYPKEMWQWKDLKTREKLEFPKGDSLPEAFLNTCERLSNREVVGDLWKGPVKYSKLKIAILFFMDQIKSLPGKHIGILLPASSAANCLIIACLLAKKTPVLLNWTVGRRHLEAVDEVVCLDVVLTSWKFIDRLDNVDLGPMTQKLLFLEDFVESASLKDKLKAWRLSKKGTKKLLSKLDYNSSKVKNDIASILFTSGSEGMPKAVPLTHTNLLESQKGGFESVDLYADDIMFSALPPFHSFGFSITGLFPLLLGMRTVFYPNPLDHEQILELFTKWKVSVVGSAPSFLRGLIKHGTQEHLESMRLVFMGAEKAPSGLIEAFLDKNPCILFAEGYGITECGPVISVNTKRIEKAGIGLPIPSVDVLIVNPDSLEPVSKGERGLLLVKGPGIFGGYWGERKQTSPFVFCQGHTWYQTGDLGIADEEGFLNLSGRSKRFIKVGGEMVSLGAIEDVLNEEYVDKTSSVPLIAACMEEKDAETLVIIFTTLELQLKKVNALLRSKGFSNLIKIHEIVKERMIPLTGTGKINYQVLDKAYHSQDISSCKR